MKFIRVKISGCINSFRQPDFHTYHRTLPLPPKTTVAGMLGSALGISPKTVNDEWVKSNRFFMGVVGKSHGKANDLWQIRKYESKQIAAYKKGSADTPYKTAVIVRELLYDSHFSIYLTFEDDDDFKLIVDSLQNPVWALSLGREDELVKISEINVVDITEKDNLYFRNTILPFDVNEGDYKLDLNQIGKGNLLTEAPRIVKVPVTFTYKKDSEVREADYFNIYTFVGDVPLQPERSTGFYDPEDQCAFQIF